MRLLPPLLLLLFLAAPLASAATDPGAREPLEPDGDRDVTAGTLARGNSRIVFGTTDPGSNQVDPSTAQRGIPDEPTWFIFDRQGENEVEAGGVDPPACSETLGGIEQDDCKTHVQSLASSKDGNRIAAVGKYDRGIAITFGAVEGSTTTVAIEGALGIGQFDMDDDGTAVAVSYSTGGVPAWRVQWYAWSNTVSTPWTDPATLDAEPTDLDMAPDGSTVAVVAGEHYYRYGPGSKEPTLHDDQFIGTGRSVAVAEDGQKTSVMGTSSGRLTFHKAATEDDDQLLNFKRASSPIDQVAITPDGKTVAWTNEAGTLGVGTFTASTNIFQVIHESSLGAKATDIDVSLDGQHIAVLAGGDLHLFAVHDNEVLKLWTDEDPGTLVAGATVTLADDGQSLAVARTDGVVVYDAIHDLNVTGDNPTLIPGQEGQLTLRFRNDGNRLAVTTLEARQQAGWTLTPDEESVVVAPGQTVQVAVDVTPAPSAEPGTATVEFLTKDRAGDDVVHKVPVQLDRVIDWAIGMRDDAPQTLSAEAGKASTFQLFVENRGNTPRAAPLRLSVSDSDWNARFTSGDGTIEPGEQADLDVQVTPPAGALELEEATVTVRLDGFGDPIELRAVVGAVFGVELEAPQGMEIQDGTSRTFNVTVRNVGNTEDSFRVGFGDLPEGWDGRFSFGLTEVSAKGIPPGGEREVPVTIQVAQGEELDVPFIITLQASSFGDPANEVEEEIFVTVVEAEVEEPDGNDSPGLPLVGLLAAVGVAVAARRSKTE